MATIFKKITVDASLATVWRNVKDLEGIKNLLSIVASSKVEGDKRVCVLQDGGRLEESILGIDETAYRLAYAITASPFDFEFHSASWRLFPEGDGTALEWWTDIKPDSAAPMVEQLIDSERDGMAAALAKGGDQ